MFKRGKNGHFAKAIGGKNDQKWPELQSAKAIRKTTLNHVRIVICNNNNKKQTQQKQKNVAQEKHLIFEKWQHFENR